MQEYTYIDTQITCISTYDIYIYIYSRVRDNWNTVTTFKYTNRYFILPPGPGGLARPRHIEMSLPYNRIKYVDKIHTHTCTLLPYLHKFTHTNAHIYNIIIYIYISIRQEKINWTYSTALKKKHHHLPRCLSLSLMTIVIHSDPLLSQPSNVVNPINHPQVITSFMAWIQSNQSHGRLMALGLPHHNPILLWMKSAIGWHHSGPTWTTGKCSSSYNIYI